MNSRGNPIFSLIGLGFFFVVLVAVSLHGLYQDEQFDQSKNRSQGTVEREWTTYGRKGSTFYHVSYHFADDRGRIWAVSNVTSQGTYQSVHMGTLVPVKFLATNPGQSRIDLPNETRYHWHQDEVPLGIALVLGGIWALIFVSTRR